MPKWIWPSMKLYRMFFVQTSILPPNMHPKTYRIWNVSMQNNQLPIKSTVELKHNSIIPVQYCNKLKVPRSEILTCWVVCGLSSSWLSPWYLCIQSMLATANSSLSTTTPLFPTMSLNFCTSFSSSFEYLLSLVAFAAMPAKPLCPFFECITWEDPP